MKRDVSDVFRVETRQSWKEKTDWNVQVVVCDSSTILLYVLCYKQTKGTLFSFSALFCLWADIESYSWKKGKNRNNVIKSDAEEKVVITGEDFELFV